MKILRNCNYSDNKKLNLNDINEIDLSIYDNKKFNSNKRYINNNNNNNLNNSTNKYTLNNFNNYNNFNINNVSDIYKLYKTNYDYTYKKSFTKLGKLKQNKQDTYSLIKKVIFNKKNVFNKNNFSNELNNNFDYIKPSSSNFWNESE